MIDTFLLLTPFLLLPVIALLCFVGCTTFSTSGSAPGSPAKITNVSPDTVTAGDPLFTLTVTGTDFVNEDVQSVVQWNGADRITTFFDSTKVTAFIFKDDIASPATANVAVNNRDASGAGTPSNTVSVTIKPPSGPGPSSGLVTVTFDNAGAANDPLNGVYKGLSFEVGKWFWKGPGAGTSIFVGPAFDTAPHSGKFSFVNPPPTGRKLVRVRAQADADGNITLDNGVDPPKTAALKAGDPPKFIDTAFSTASATVSVSSSVGWDIAIDTIVYEGPA